MSIKSYENRIIRQLQTTPDITAVIPALAIESFPGDVKSYNVLNPFGAILVRFNSRTSNARSGNQQTALLEYELRLLMKNIRTAQDSYDMIDNITKAVGSTRLPVPGLMFYPVSERLITDENGIWEYSLRYTVAGLYINGEDIINE